MLPDYPAAHSMDTTWFAVDRCGHVGIFWSGEDGAVPQGAPDADDTLEADRPFPGELDRCLRERSLTPGTHATEILPALSDGTAPIARGFYLLGGGLKSDRTRIRKPDLSGPKYSWIHDPVFGTTDGRDWVDGILSPESWTWLHGAPHRCLGCVGYLTLDFERRMDVLRVFRFRCDHYGKSPYDRENAPYNPATLEELRALDLGPLPQPPVFSAFCFREKQRLQPLQWLLSRTWGSAEEWVDEEGRPRKGGAKTVK